MSGQRRRQRNGRQQASRYSDDYVRYLLRIPIQRRMEWLEEGIRFLDQAMTPEAKRIRDIMREGGIKKLQAEARKVRSSHA